MRRAERSLSTGQQGGVAPLDVRQVDAGVGADEAVAGLADDQVAAAAQDAHRLALDQRLVAQRIVGVDGHQPVLGLGHDLLGDDHDVAVGQGGVGRRPRPRGDDAGQVVARRRSRRCPRGRTPPCGSSADLADGRAPSTVRPSGGRPRPGSDMIVGATTQRMPSASTASARSASAVSITSVAGQLGVEAGHADHRRLVAELDQQAVGRTLERGAGDDGRHRHDVVAAGHDGVADAGHGQHRPDRDDRVGRGDHDRARPPAMAASTPGAGPAPSAPSKRTARHRHRVLAADEVLLERDLALRSAGR